MDLATPYDLKHLRNRIRPLELRHAQTIVSTNDWAKQEVESEQQQASALFIADTQSAGRGRGTNTWWSAHGNVTATFVLTQNPQLPFGLVPLLTGLAVRNALVQLTGIERIGLKWPNDLVIDGRKVGGLLCERLQKVDLIGIGLNVNAGGDEAPAELREQLTSLRELARHAWELTDVICEVSHSVTRMLSLETANAACEMLKEYAQHHWPTGKNVEMIDTDRAPRIEGRCEGVDPHGRLLVRNERGLHSLLTGSMVSVGSILGRQ
jgi:BirA family biotin operon repressor/biotin-[acetyl-CoA-carboxylase] ligase